jgi:protein associated with RNAse G/E
VARGSLEFFEQKLQNVKMVFLKEEGFLYVCQAAARVEMTENKFKYFCFNLA